MKQAVAGSDSNELLSPRKTLEENIRFNFDITPGTYEHMYVHIDGITIHSNTFYIIHTYVIFYWNCDILKKIVFNIIFLYVNPFLFVACS